MKKIIIAVVVLLSLNTTFAQTQSQKDSLAFMKAMDWHVARVFPKQLPVFVYQNSEAVAVTKKMQKEQFLLSGDESGIGYLREGDTVLVFRGQPYYSHATRLFIEPVPEVAKVKVKTQKPPRERRPMSPEAIGNGVITIFRVATYFAASRPY